MNDISTIAQVVGFLVQAVGLITVAVRTGSWKGSLENRVDALEKQASQTVQELSAVDNRQGKGAAQCLEKAMWRWKVS